MLYYSISGIKGKVCLSSKLVHSKEVQMTLNSKETQVTLNSKESQVTLNSKDCLRFSAC